MAPLLRPGRFFMVDDRAFLSNKPQVGDIVLAKHPESGIEIVKRVDSITDDGRYHLLSTNKDMETASDSRDFGALSLELITAKVTSVVDD